MQDVFLLPPGRTLLHLVTPIAIGFVVLMLIDFSDVIVARIISSKAVAVLAFCYPIIYFMIAVGLGINQGLTIVGSEAFIKEGRSKLYELFVQSLFLSAFCVLALQCLVYILVNFKLINASFLPYLSQIRVYLYIMVSGVLALFLLLILFAICQIEGKVNVIRDTLGLMLILTLFLHPIFALPVGLDWELTGIAISKVLVCLIGCSYAANQVICWETFRNSDRRFSLPKLNRLLKQSFPAITIQMLVPTYLMILTRLVSHYGLDATAGFSLGYRIVMVVIIPILGIFTALLVMITHDFLLHKFERVKQTIKLSIGWGSIVILAVLALTYLLSYVVFAMCDALTSVEQIALQYIQLAMYIAVLEYWMGVCTTVFQAIRRPFIAFLIAATRTFFIPMPVFYMLSNGNYELSSVWSGIALCFTISAVISLLAGYNLFYRKY